MKVGETHPEVTQDQAAILSLLLEVFTLGQLLKLAKRMHEVRANRFGGVKIIVHKNRMLFERVFSDDEGTVAWCDERNL